MDKITRIHIAKTPYEIEVDAEVELKKYLDAIRSRLDDDLADEILTDIEFRITEILSDRNIHRNDVITSKDIEAIRHQLGSPEQFNDDETSTPKKEAPPTESKRLFRDSDGAIIGGVASGLAAYFSIDPIFIRIIFILLTFASGLGIVIYILLWILLPAAKTNSDKLLMRGEPVTAAALQNYRSNIQQTMVNPRLRAALVIAYKTLRVLFTIGTALFILGLLSSIGFGSAILYTKPLHQPYIAYHLNYLLLGLLWLFTMTVIGLLIVILFKLWRRSTASLKIASIGLISTLILTMAGIAIVSPFIVSHYRNLYGGNNLTVTLPVTDQTPKISPTSLNVSANSNLIVTYEVSSQPLHATYKDYPGMNQPKIAIVNKDGAISVQAHQLAQVAPSCVLNWCQNIYLPVRIIVYGPAVQKYSVNGGAELDVNNVTESTISLTAINNSNLSISNSFSGTLNATAQSDSTVDASDATSQATTITVQNGSYVFGPASNTVNIMVPGVCDSPLIEFTQTPTTITFNNQPMTVENFSQNNCINLDDPSPYNGFIFQKSNVAVPEAPTAPPIPNVVSKHIH